jgi:dihydroneopterin aldolase
VHARVVIEGLEFPGHCGVSAEERASLQPIGVDLELDYAPDHFARAATTDRIQQAIDYATVARRVREIGTGRDYQLLEAMTEQVCKSLFAEFPVSRVHLWVRKLKPPVDDVTGSVGIRLERTRAEQHLLDAAVAIPPASFLAEHLHTLPKGRALDVAAGRGRNALCLASLGYQVDALDRDEEALATIAAMAAQRNLPNVTVRQVDLENPEHPADLGHERYDVILVFFYLYRPLFPALLASLKPGGMLVYETFLIENHLRFQHPKRREFCLEHNELLRLTQGLRVLHYEEGEAPGPHGSETAFAARLLAVRDP